MPKPPSFSPSLYKTANGTSDWSLPPKYIQDPDTTDAFHVIVGLELLTITLLVILFYCQAYAGSELTSVNRPGAVIDKNAKRRQSTQDMTDTTSKNVSPNKSGRQSRVISIENGDF